MLRKFFAKKVGTVFAASPESVHQTILEAVKVENPHWACSHGYDDAYSGEYDYHGKDGLTIGRLQYWTMPGHGITLAKVSCIPEMVDGLKAALRPYKLSSAAIASGRDVLSNMGTRASGWTPQEQSVETPDPSDPSPSSV